MTDCYESSLEISLLFKRVVLSLSHPEMVKRNIHVYSAQERDVLLKIFYEKRDMMCDMWSSVAAVILKINTWKNITKHLM